MSKAKVWIAGAKGQLGSAVREMLEQGGAHELLTTDRDVDITDLERVCAYTDGNAPDVIINCAGLTDLAVCERHVEDAYRVNALGARNLAIAAKRTDAKLIHISTDDVFDGTAKKPLTEFDHVNPRTVYGKSKLAGEDFVRELASRHVIVRSSWIYGYTKNNFVSYILEGLLTEDTIFVPVDQVSTPTSARELARRSRGTPRLANRLLKRVRDFAQVKYQGRITGEVACLALDLLEVDKNGLDQTDRLLLRTIIEKFSGGPVGLDTLAAAVGEDSGTIEDVYEPYLIQHGFLSRTPRGRVAMRQAYTHLGLPFERES